MEKDNSEIVNKLQHKLKIKIDIPSEMKNSELYAIDKDRTIIKCNIVCNTPTQIRETQNSIENIIAFCTLHKYGSIALNANFSKQKDYFQFKQILYNSVKDIKLKITIFLNKIIEIFDIDEIDSILKTYHTSMLGGHFGFERMKNNIRKFFYWSSMTNDIKKFVRNCEICEKTKVHKHTKPPLQISSTATAPFEKIYMDLVGPISPMGSKGNLYVFTCSCDLTKYAIAVPMRDCSALTTAKAFVHGFVLKYGFPTEIVSDNGTNFVSELLKEVTKLLKVKHILTTPYHPQANQVERFHRNLANYMKAFVKSDTTHWDIYLDYATFAYNISVNSTTGYSPFELVYGHAIELPISITNNKNIGYNYENYANEIRNKMRHCHELARENILKRKEANKEQYDRTHHSDITLKRNDLVLILKNKKNFKFDDPYEGPYRVEKMLSPVSVLVRKKKKSIRVHLNQIKRAIADYGDKVPPEI